MNANLLISHEINSIDPWDEEIIENIKSCLMLK